MTASSDPEAVTAAEPAEPGREQSNATAGGGLPVRATTKVSMRDLAAAENMSSPVNLRNLASKRGVNREFALREVITPQTYETSEVGSLRSSSKQTWENWLEDYDSNAYKFQPSDGDQIRQIIVWATNNDQKVRAVGAGHSHSRAAQPSENYIELSRYDGDDDELRGLVGAQSARPRISNLSSAKHYGPGDDPATSMSDLEAVRVAAGSPLKYLNRKVLKDRDLGILNMGSFDAQTIAGAINTATHGTGIGLGTLADIVLSFEMVSVTESSLKDDEPVVRKFRIEPTNGITNVSKFEENVGTHDTTLIQDDDVFHSTVVGYGAMGVATSYTIKVRDHYFLYENSVKKKWNKLKGNNGLIEKKLNASDVRHFNFLLNIPKVYGSPSTENPFCMARTRKFESSWKSKPKKSPPSWPPRRTAKAMQDFSRFLRDQTTGAGVDPMTKNPFLASLINNFFGSQTNKPFKSNGLTKQHDTANYVALRRTPDKNYDNPRKIPKPPASAMTTEVAVPVEEVDAAVQTVIDEVQRMQQNQGFHYAAPLGVRFTASSEHYLSAEYDGENEWSRPDGVAMIELPFPVDRVNARIVNTIADLLRLLNPANIIVSLAQLLNLLPRRNISQKRLVKLSKQALKPIEEKLIEKHDGRPHMGKYNSLDCKDLEEMYDEFDTWHDVYLDLNAFGTFNNGFTNKLGLDVTNTSSSGPTTNCNP
jgi:hypothetical protein